MKRYSVTVTKKARHELDEAITFIKQDWPDYAARFLQQIEAAIDSLDHLPERFPPVGRSKKRGLPTHRMVVEDYLVYYRIEPGEVYVTMVRHAARRPPRRFD